MRTLPKFPESPIEPENVPRTDQASNDRSNSGRQPVLLLVIIDGILVNLAFMLAWFIRYELQIGREVAQQDYLPLGSYAGIQLTFAVLMLVTFWLKGLYRTRRRLSWAEEFTIFATGSLISVAILVVGVFYFRPFGYSRLTFIYAFVLCFVFLTVSRIVVSLIRDHRRRRGLGLRRVLLVGGGSLGRAIIQNIVAQPELGYHIVGFVDDIPREKIGRIPYLGSAEQTPTLVDSHEVAEVIIALPSASHKQVTGLLMAVERQNVTLRIVPDFYDLSVNQLDIESINGIPLVRMREARFPGHMFVLKRVLDIVGASILLILAAPLMLIIAIAIRIDSSGPMIVRQRRVGRQGKPFDFYKFRSMIVDAEERLPELMAHNETEGPLFKIKDDPRVTRVGRAIRRFSLDEVPQFYNVLRGDMSLVGPRPALPREVERYQDWHLRRLSVPPGITGLWQVSGRSDLPFDEMALLDIWYVENWSLGLEITIILRTIPAVLFGYGAY